MKGPMEIVPGVWGLGSEMVNWYVVEDQGRLVAIDGGLSGFGDELDSDLARVGHQVSDIEAVIVTHSDSDHTGLIPRFQEAGAKVLVHPADHDTLAKPPKVKGGDANPRNVVPHLWRPMAVRLMAHMLSNGGGRPPEVEADATFADGEALDVPGRPRAIHTPGHTPGHTMFLFEEKRVLFCGDALYDWNFLAGSPLSGRRGPQVGPKGFHHDADGAWSSLSRIEPLDADVMLFGHGNPWRGGPVAAVARARELGPS
jgi:glyoxylase-like metal-dependent hydrolase (beta-lactamase superfamily II)